MISSIPYLLPSSTYFVDEIVLGGGEGEEENKYPRFLLDYILANSPIGADVVVVHRQVVVGFMMDARRRRIIQFDAIATRPHPIHGPPSSPGRTAVFKVLAHREDLALVHIRAILAGESAIRTGSGR